MTRSWTHDFTAPREFVPLTSLTPEEWRGRRGAQLDAFRKRLSAIAGRVDDPELADLLHDVADGKESPRVLMTNEGFGKLAMSGLQEVERRRSALSEQERERADAAARGQMAEDLQDRLDAVSGWMQLAQRTAEEAIEQAARPEEWPGFLGRR